MSAIAYRNPVHPGYLADPFVWRHEGEYLAVGTGAAEAAGQAPTTAGRRPSLFPLLRSPDLVHWREAGHALLRPDVSLGDSFWAPEVAQHEGRWYLYYSVGHGDARHQLRVAASDSPLGPYEDVAALTDTDEVPFAIDPHPFRDHDGRWYLFHARDFLDADDTVRAGTALVVQPLADMTRLVPPLRTVARARQDWQRYAAGRAMYGRLFDWHTQEGPFVVRERGRYWCLYSGGCWQHEGYGVDFVVADHVLGPYADDAPPCPRVLRSVPGHVPGPGHCSVTRAGDGATPVIAYHAWDAQRGARRLCIDTLRFTPDGPRADGPTWTEQRLPR